MSRESSNQRSRMSSLGTNLQDTPDNSATITSSSTTSDIELPPTTTINRGVSELPHHARDETKGNRPRSFTWEQQSVDQAQRGNEEVSLGLDQNPATYYLYILFDLNRNITLCSMEFWLYLFFSNPRSPFETLLHLKRFFYPCDGSFVVIYFHHVPYFHSAERITFNAD